MTDEILIELEGTSLTIGEVLSRVESYRADPRFRHKEIFMDGDRFAIVARVKPSGEARA